MKRSLVAGLGLAVIGGGLLALVLGPRIAPKPRPQPTTTAAARAAAEAPITAGRYAESGPGYAITASYPTTTPLAGSANDAALEAMQGWVIGQVSAFKARPGGPAGTLVIGYDSSSSPAALSYVFTAQETGRTTDTITSAWRFSLPGAGASAHP
ncbi:MAG: hypothetical protein KGI78_01415 [Patescibacteria group bacterium]|nr:hypothetical protein [Patescibacteria group bacterium]MDE1944100.1 hypothetical protein [Patescibacteria group bacterium]MDE1945033.1 hypothetical protein [Patescibacteria group bacterium]MDE2057493.1 hypothetical protein [Patescibacteria group bacterium]